MTWIIRASPGSTRSIGLSPWSVKMWRLAPPSKRILKKERRIQLVLLFLILEPHNLCTMMPEQIFAKEA